MSRLKLQETNEQMQRFFDKMASGELRDMPLEERGILFTLIGLSEEKYCVGEVEDILPDSTETLRKHLNSLVEQGFVSFAPEDAGKQISRRHYVVCI